MAILTHIQTLQKAMLEMYEVSLVAVPQTKKTKTAGMISEVNKHWVEKTSIGQYIGLLAGNVLVLMYIAEISWSTKMVLHCNSKVTLLSKKNFPKDIVLFGCNMQRRLSQIG